MKKLYIIGAAGFGKEVAWIVEEINKKKKEWEIIGFIDDNNDLIGTNQNGYNVLGNVEYLCDISDDIWVVCTIGDTTNKKKIIERISNIVNIHFATIIAPTAIVPPTVDIGEGTVIASASVLSVNVMVGAHVSINMGCTIGHDTRVEDYVTIRPGADIAGNVVIGKCADIGIGAKIIQNIKVCEGSLIGGGAMVIKDILKFQTVVGVPARPIKEIGNKVRVKNLC